MGTSRVAYNAAVAHLRTPGTKANWKAIKGGLLRSLPSWSEETPYQIRSIAIRDACKAVRDAKRKFRQTGEIQEVHFRSRKCPIQSCYIPKSAFRSGGIYPTLSRGEIRKVEEVPKKHGDLRLFCERGRWFLSVPVQQKRDVAENQGRVVALDPGIRSFQTFYAEGSCGKLAEGDFGQIQRLCAHLDDLLSRRKLEKHRLRKKNLRGAILRLQNRIHDLVDELHHKVAVFLVKSFDVIVLPTFETKDMVQRGARKLRAKSVRSMLTFAHFRFRKFMKHKAFEHGKLVLDQNEAWTSKTVSWTGEVNVKLGGAKVIRSAATGLEMDRDYNGARGIFLRALGDQPVLRGNLKNASAPDATSVASGSEK
jgi:putative transposase